MPNVPSSGAGRCPYASAVATDDGVASLIKRCFKGAIRTALFMTALVATGLALATVATADSVGFDHDATGTLPPGWACGSTDGGAPRWKVEQHDTAPSPPNVLKQTGSGSFPWCVKQGTAFTDGAVEVKFSLLAGNEDQTAGLVWRWRDGDTYYVARADALVAQGSGNVSLSYVTNGRLRHLKQVEAPVEAHAWHTLRVEFKGASIRVLLNDQVRIEFEDRHLAGVGAVGVWTSADSVTAFDDFSWNSSP